MEPSNILKPHTPHTVNALKLARTIKMRATLEAETIISSAKKAAKAIEDESRERGMDIGRSQALSDYQKLEKDLLEESRGHVIRLAVLVAEEMLKTEINSNPCAFLPKIESEIEQMRTTEPKTLFLSSRNAEALRESLSAEISVEADASLSEFEFKIHGANGEVCSHLEKQLDVVENKLLQSSSNILETLVAK